MRNVLLVSLLFCFSLASGESERECISLDGAWKIAFDENNKSRNETWYMPKSFSDLEYLESIDVPSCWETIRKDYEGVAVYGKKFKVPSEWKNKAIRLHFDAVNYRADVWLNGYAVGQHEGGYGPFEFQVDDLIKVDETNFLSVRVLGPIVNQDKIIDGLGKNDAPHWRGAIAGGIWQSVKLIASGQVFIDDLFVIPNINENKANIQLSLNNSGLNKCTHEVIVEVKDKDSGSVVSRKSRNIVLQPGKKITKWSMPIPNAKYWSPKSPHLYEVKAIIVKQDNESHHFGMRELTIKNEEFILNGEPIYIKAAFFEGLYPTKLALPDSREMAIKEIQLAKEAGFNMIRPWRKPPPKMWLDLCDKMGMMVVGGLPIECMKLWPTVTPEMPNRIENEVRSAILRDRNRACIVQWEMFNEIWRKELKRLKHKMSMIARELDPSRLILDESGGFADGANIYLPYEVEPITFNDVHIYCGYPINNLTYSQFLALGMNKEEMEKLGYKASELENKHTSPGKMTLVSEIGYGSVPDLKKNNKSFKERGNPLTPPYRYHQMLEETTLQALKQSGLDSIYPNLDDFCKEQQSLHASANKRIIEAVRSNPNVSGYCVHALTGGDWVLGAGLLDLWRNKKLSYYSTKEANADRYLAIRVLPRNIYSEIGAEISITGINDIEEIRTGQLEIEIFNDQGRRVKRWEIKSNFSSGVNALFSNMLKTHNWSGLYKAVVTYKSLDDKNIIKNSYNFNVFNSSDLKVPEFKIAVIDPENLLTPFLEDKNIKYEHFSQSTDILTPVFVSSARKRLPQFSQLEKFVERGGKAIYLETLFQTGRSYWTTRLPPKGVLPFSFGKEHALGLWVGVSHIVCDHSIFDGLESNKMMGDLYQNIWSPFTMVDIDGELIVSSITHGFYGGKKHEQQCYLGPEPAFYGMDMGIVPYGDGSYLLSALRIIPSLGADPVADKVFFNMIKWACK